MSEDESRVVYFKDAVAEMTRIYAAKNHDYGNSFATIRKRYPSSILIRLFDKLNRLETLMSGEQSLVKDESIDDTLLDLANYAVMELVERRIDKERDDERD